MAAYQFHHVKMGWLDPVVRRPCHAVDLAGTRESVMSEPESVKLVQAARLELRVPVAERMRQAGALDDRFGADYVSSTARQVVAAWVMAVDGDDTALAAIAEPHAAYRLMNPVRKSWQVGPGPRVTQIQVWGLEADREPPRAAEFCVNIMFTLARSDCCVWTQRLPVVCSLGFTGMLDLSAGRDNGPL